jgi:nucleotide-binding universal stress UspA family protein
MKILICTDGSSAAEQSALLVDLLHLQGNVEITLLGVIEDGEGPEILTLSFDRMERMIGHPSYQLNRLLRKGDSVEQIMAEAIEHHYDLVVVGGTGQQLGLLNYTTGSTTAKLARKLHTHFLVARNVPDKIKKVLVCTGAEAPTIETMRVGGMMLAGLRAEVAVLHVVSQIPVTPEAYHEAIAVSAMEAIERKTREGQHLQRAVAQLTRAGVKSQIQPRLRYGQVVKEILDEVVQGRYDLMVVGSHYQPGQNRWLGVLLDDITDQLMNQAQCSVMIV